MIPARHTWLGRQFWGGFSRWAIKLAFHQFAYPEDFSVARDRATLLVGNHISWWDGFWPLELNRRLFKKRYHVMMLEKELRKRPFMTQGGAFSIKPGSRDVLNSLRYAGALLHDPANLVMVYPQGSIHSQHGHLVKFAPGIYKLLAYAPAEVQVVFSATFLDYGAQARPTLTYYLEAGEYNANTLNPGYQDFFNRCLRQQQAVWRR